MPAGPGPAGLFAMGPVPNGPPRGVRPRINIRGQVPFAHHFGDAMNQQAVQEGMQMRGSLIEEY